MIILTDRATRRPLTFLENGETWVLLLPDAQYLDNLLTRRRPARLALSGVDYCRANVPSALSMRHVPLKGALAYVVANFTHDFSTAPELTYTIDGDLYPMAGDAAVGYALSNMQPQVRPPWRERPSRAISAFTVGLPSRRILFREAHSGLAATSHAALADILPRNVMELVTPIPIELPTGIARRLQSGGTYFTFLANDLSPHEDGEDYSLSWDADIDVIGADAADAFMRDIFAPSNRTLREELNALRLQRDRLQALRTTPPPSAFAKEVLRMEMEVVPAQVPVKILDLRERKVRRRRL